MLFPDIHPHDIVNAKLRSMALNAAERGDASAAWHGTDRFTGEDVEIYMNLTRKVGALALGGQAFSGLIGEKGHLLLIHFDNSARGIVAFDHRGEDLPMNLERTGIEVFNDQVHAALRLFDKLSGQDILTLGADDMHELVDEKTLNPKDYHGSAFKYAQATGLI